MPGVLSRLAALKTMSVKNLKVEWRSLFGSDAPNNSRFFLELRLSYRIQELAQLTTRLLDALADDVEGKAGTLLCRSRSAQADGRHQTLAREWNGIEHTVTALRDGF